MNLWPFVFALFALGIFCLLTRRNLVKILIGLELLSKGATLALIWSGILRNSLAYTQSLAVIVIAIEVMVVAIFLALVYAFHEKSSSLDTDDMRRLKG
jgi:NADH:ubiquinone oxidoreductase subunit K